MAKKIRCPWLNESNPLYVRYHDREWGRPIRDDQRLFEMLILEGAQAGLSWETVLKKRDRYRQQFFHFDPIKVSQLEQADIEQRLQDAGLIRNRLKIESTVSNAKAFLAVQAEFGSFSKYVWGFVDHKPLQTTFQTLADYPARTEVSDRLSKDLKKRGFRFVGSTIVYAFMQAIGMSQDHAVDCFLHAKALRALD